MKTTRPTSRATTPLWHILVALLLVWIPSQLQYGNVPWALPRETLVFLAGLAFSYIASATLIALRNSRAEGFDLVSAALSIAATFGVLFLGILLLELSYSRLVLVAAFLVALPSIWLSRWISSPRWHLVPILLVGCMWLLGKPPTTEETELTSSIEKRLVTTAFYNLALTFHRNQLGFPEVPGGALALFEQDYLLASGDGRFFFLERRDANAPLALQQLPYTVPVNRKDFLEANPNGLKDNRFRVNDIFVIRERESVRLLATHHFWKREEACFVLRLSSARAVSRDFRTGSADLEWETVYETTPCLPYRNAGAFPGHESGGRMIRLDDDHLLFSVGHHLRKAMAQDPATSYGKMIRFDLANDTAAVFSIGHRNPQGIYLAGDGTIWSTEHGPQGGDELNIVRENQNYGWPFVTYGTNYGSFRFKSPLAHVDRSGIELEGPIFSWVPSIATSNLIGIEGTAFAQWQGDLLVSSLEAKSLMRLRVRDGRVVYSEPILIGERIRDVLEDPQGRLLLWTDWGSLVFIEVQSDDGAPGDDAALRGQALFAQCTGCHPVVDGNSHGIGPDLQGVAGRSIGTASGYFYSDALKNRRGVWDAKALEAFLSDPAAFAPGNSMESVRVVEPKDRRALIAYLQTLD